MTNHCVVPPLQGSFASLLSTEVLPPCSVQLHPFLKLRTGLITVVVRADACKSIYASENIIQFYVHFCFLAWHNSLAHSTEYSIKLNLVLMLMF